jgi:hypothetical protein
MCGGDRLRLGGARSLSTVAVKSRNSLRRALFIRAFSGNLGVQVDFAFMDGWHTFDYTLLDFFYTDKLGGHVQS